MKVSIEWMRDYVPVEGDLQALADTLTQAGIHVEEVENMDKGIKKVYTGKIVQIDKHPDADKLVVCQIDCLSEDGEKEVKQIVTGATNVRVGQIIPVAYHKSKLPDKSISKGKLRGVMSEGMLCSINELGLSKDVFLPEEAEGIYILPNDVEIGKDIKEVMHLDDTVFLFELTPNRADCFSMVGLSREFAIMTEKEATMPEIHVVEGEESIEGKAHIAIEDEELCTRFTSRLVRNIKIGPSPLWMQNRLRNAGIRPINNVVDVTNYVMIELGQPMHAYDYDLVKGHSLIARKAKAGEEITTLDGNKRKLDESMLVIADESGPVGVAGVMGGLDTEVTDKTTNVLLEAAVFKGGSIRRTAKALGMRSEASGRFERGINAAFTPLALDRAAQLLQNMCPEVIVDKGIIDVYPVEKEERTVSFTAEQVNAHLGTSLDGAQMVHILEKLHFTVEEKDGVYVATIPSWRDDVAFMCDVAGEVARIYGYDHIVPTTPIANLQGGHKSEMATIMEQSGDYLVQAGMNECITFSFMHKDSLAKLNLPEGDSRYMAVPILNPISEEFPYMRTTLVPSMLETAYKNLAKKNKDLALYEVAAVYEPKALPLEDFVNHRQMICGFMVGNTQSPAWPQVKRPCDFYDVKGIVEGLLEHLGVRNASIVRSESPYLHPGVSAEFIVEGIRLASLGELHPQVAKAYDMPNKSFIFEVDLQALLSVTRTMKKFESISKFPGVSRDLAIVAPTTVTSEAIVALINEHGGEYLQDVYLFDVYEGEHIEAGHRSLAYNLSFQAMDRTLEDKDIDGPIEKVIESLESVHCKLR